MSYMLYLEAYSKLVTKDGQFLFKKDEPVTKEQIDYMLGDHDEVCIEGKICIGAGRAYHYILEWIKGKEGFIFESDEYIYAVPDDMICLLMGAWRDWHKADPRPGWKRSTIKDFIKCQQYWAIILIRIY